MSCCAQVGNFAVDHDIQEGRKLTSEQYEPFPGTFRPVYEMNSTHMGMDMAAEATSAYMSLSTLFEDSDPALAVRNSVLRLAEQLEQSSHCTGEYRCDGSLRWLGSARCTQNSPGKSVYSGVKQMTNTDWIFGSQLL